MQYIQAAEDLGYDTNNPKAVRNLITCVKYWDLKNSDRKLRDVDICAQLGMSNDALQELKKTDAYITASKLLLAEFLDSEARQSSIHRLFAIYDKLPEILENIANKALGEPVKATNKDGKEETFYVPFRDQIAAATLLLNNPVANAWLNSTFIGEQQTDNPQIDVKQRLLEAGKVLQLDDEEEVIEGQVSDTDSTVSQ